MLVTMKAVFEMERTVASAIAATGLDDFGPGDWRDAMERLVERSLSRTGQAADYYR